MQTTDYLAVLIFIGCVLWGLLRLDATAIAPMPVFVAFLVLLIPSAGIWLFSWFSLWPYYFPVVTGACAAASVEAAWMVSANLYYTERKHARWTCLSVGLLTAAVIWNRSPEYPGFSKKAFLLGSMLSGFAAGCSTMAVLYWIRFRSASVRPFVGQAACLALYSAVGIAVSPRFDLWHASVAVSTLMQAALISLGCQCLAGRKSVPEYFVPHDGHFD